MKIVLGALLLCLGTNAISDMSPAAKHYECTPEGACVPLKKGLKSDMGMGSCQITCGEGNLWPQPRIARTVGKVTRSVSRSSFSFAYTNTKSATGEMLQAASNQFLETITRNPKARNNNNQQRAVKVAFEVAQDDESLTMTTDESYTLKIDEQEEDVLVVTITSKSYFGARHALETLGQLVVYDALKESMVMPTSVAISDSPAFPYRGLLIDTSRHFLPIWFIEKIILGMSYTKMNRLHLHITDTASFPIQIKSRPNMTKTGAYSAEEMYSKEDITDLVKFGLLHGVQLIPEIDAPAHTHMGWEWAEEDGQEPLVLCTDNWASQALEPPGGQLNIVNENVYNVLGDIYDEVAEMFNSSIWHLGGDEVIVGSDESWGACWNKTAAAGPILDYIKANGLDRNDKQTFYSLWKNFTTRAKGLVDASYKKSGIKADKAMQWAGAGTGGEPVIYNLFGYDDVVNTLSPDDFMLQVWDESEGSISPKLAKMGYDMVLSHSDYTYLDCGGSGWAKPGGYWCNPYHEWYRLYDYIPDVIQLWNFTDKDTSFIKGAETAIWGEQADQQNVETKVWPRTAALAERLWSNPPTNWYAADPRMQMMRERLVSMNISAEPLQTQWCVDNGAYACTLNSDAKPV